VTKLSRGKQLAILEKLLTKDDLAAFLNVKKRVVENYVHDGTFPHIKIRAAVRFRLADVERVLNELTVRGSKKDRERVPTVANQGEVCTK
jgi:excisionase family DNA binding protein